MKNDLEAVAEGCVIVTRIHLIGKNGVIPIKTSFYTNTNYDVTDKD